MIVRHLLAAVVAGVMAGMLMTVVQQVKVVPLILHAEEYEGQEAPSGEPHQHGASTPHSVTGQLAALLSPVTQAHAHEHEAESGEGGTLADIGRFAGSLGANIVAGGGFALLLSAASLLLGKPITPQNGLAWGACGWLAVQFLPALGLPPELPGFPAADLAARQVWWVATILCSVAGLGLVAFRPELPARLLGLMLIVAPHLWGAPQPDTIESAVPAVLASEFAVAALGAALVMWLTIGLGLAHVNARLEKAGG